MLSIRGLGLIFLEEGGFFFVERRDFVLEGVGGFVSCVEGGVVGVGMWRRRGGWSAACELMSYGSDLAPGGIGFMYSYYNGCT